QLHNPLQPTPRLEQVPPPVAAADMPIPTTPRHPARRTKGLYIGLIALLAILVVGSGGLYALFTLKGTTPPTNPVVGHVNFLNSPNAPVGTLDEVQITLPSIPDAPAGKTYYAWLKYHEDNTIPDKWPLTVQNGSVASYTDGQHRNLPPL